MPVVFIKKINSSTFIGLWNIDGKIKAIDVCPKSVCKEISHMCTKRQEETIAVYALLQEIKNVYSIGASDNTQDTEELIISHDSNGKPLLNNGWQISISHTVGYASIIISQNESVSVDIEYISNRIFKICNRFLNSSETLDFNKSSQRETLEQKRTRLLLYWCAKEATYKYFSEEKLTFDEMIVNIDYTINDFGNIYVTNKKSRKRISIEYMQNNDFVLTYTY